MNHFYGCLPSKKFIRHKEKYSILSYFDFFAKKWVIFSAALQSHFIDWKKFNAGDSRRKFFDVGYENSTFCLFSISILLKMWAFLYSCYTFSEKNECWRQPAKFFDSIKVFRPFQTSLMLMLIAEYFHEPLLFIRDKDKLPASAGEIFQFSGKSKAFSASIRHLK